MALSEDLFAERDSAAISARDGVGRLICKVRSGGNASDVVLMYTIENWTDQGLGK